MILRLTSILVLLLVSTFSAYAEGEDLRYPFIEQWRREAQRPVTPRQSPLENQTRRLRPTRQAPTTFALPSTESEKAPVLATTVITVIGDSWGVQLGQGLREAMSAKPELGVANKARSDTGLVNTSVRDWPKAAKEIAMSPDRNDLTIVMIGSNDNQPLKDETGLTVEPGTDKWKEIYAKRVDEIIAAFKEKKTPLIWVGAPITKLDKLNSNLLMLNTLFREHVQSAGHTYIDIWEAFADVDGRYAASGPDIAGEIVKLRAADHVHFTKTGARKLAFFVEKEITALLSGAPSIPRNLPASPTQLAPPVPVLQSALPQSPADIRNAVPLPDAASLAPVLQKREAGPIVPLSAPPVSASAKLAERPANAVPPADAALVSTRKLASEVFTEGRAPYPKPNRGDDFSWPRR